MCLWRYLPPTDYRLKICPLWPVQEVATPMINIKCMQTFSQSLREVNNKFLTSVCYSIKLTESVLLQETPGVGSKRHH